MPETQSPGVQSTPETKPPLAMLRPELTAYEVPVTTDVQPQQENTQEQPIAKTATSPNETPPPVTAPTVETPLATPVSSEQPTGAAQTPEKMETLHIPGDDEHKEDPGLWSMAPLSETPKMAQPEATNETSSVPEMPKVELPEATVPAPITENQTVETPVEKPAEITPIRRETTMTNNEDTEILERVAVFKKGVREKIINFQQKRDALEKRKIQVNKEFEDKRKQLEVEKAMRDQELAEEGYVIDTAIANLEQVEGADDYLVGNILMHHDSQSRQKESEADQTQLKEAA